MKATRVFPILNRQSRQESEHFANHNPHKKVRRDLTEKKQDLTEKSIILMVLTEVLSQQDFIIIKLENLDLTWLISVRVNEN